MGSYRKGPKWQIRPRNLKLIVAVAADPRKQYEIALEADLWPDQFSQIKNGFRLPTPAQREAIAAALGMEVADLFDSEAMAS